MEKLTEDSSPQISVSEVTYNEDSGTALIKFETLQGEAKMTNLKILRWVVFAACMALLAILAIKFIIRILKVCSNHIDHYSLNTKTTQNHEHLNNEGKYLAVTSAPPSLTEARETYFDSSNIISIAQNQERLNREIKFLEQGKE